MIRQTILSFKIEKTQDTITAHGGLALFGEFVVGTGILGEIDEHLPKPGSSVGYKASEYIFPIVLILNGGGRSLEDIRVIRQDEGLKEILPLKRIPSTDAIGDWLRIKGVDGRLEPLDKVEQILIKQGMKKEECTSIYKESRIYKALYGSDAQG